MARPETNEIGVRRLSGARGNGPKPWIAHWRRTAKSGERSTAIKAFATESEARAFAEAAREERDRPTGDPATLPPEPPREKILPRASAAVETLSPAEIEAVANAKPGTLTFRQFASWWLQTIVSRRKHATQHQYRTQLRCHVFPKIGSVRLSSQTFTATHILTVVGAAGLGWATQKQIIHTIGSCLNWAVRGKHLDANPAHKLLKDLRDDSKGEEFGNPEPNPLTAAQANAFLDWLETGHVPGKATDDPVDGPRRRRVRRGYPEWVPFFVTLFRTGMRRGEAAALKWETVYLDRVGEDGVAEPRAILKASYSKEMKRAIGGSGDTTLKGKRAHEIDLAPEVVEVLRELARTRHATALAKGYPVSPYVFLTPRGGRVLTTIEVVDRVFAEGMRAIGAGHAAHTLHDTRHTFATSHLLTDPASLYWVSYMLGHRHVTTTIKSYTKWIPSVGAGRRFVGSHDRTTRTVEVVNAGGESPAPIVSETVSETKLKPRLVSGRVKSAK